MTSSPSIRTFHARRGRMSSSRLRILDDIVPRFELAHDTRAIDLHDATGASKVIIDFGCGMGDATIALLTEQPDAMVLAIDVHTPGICRIAEFADENNLEQLRIHHGDGFIVLEQLLAESSVDTMLVLFPDPWPKAKHHKRRLIQPSFLALVHRLLNADGQLVIATDDSSYAEHINEVIDICDLFSRNPTDYRIPSTGFARRGIKLGNSIEIFTLNPLTK